jgi:trans-aconitate methyltransferase
MADNDFHADAYDDAQSFVYEYGRDLLELLDPRPNERILDVGCGTGHLTAAIAERADEAVGIDDSAEMVARAREEYPDLRFERVDARNVAPLDPFDAVFSNAALHWIPGPDHDDVLASVGRSLDYDGRFVAEMGGAGNVAGIVDATVAELDARGYAADVPWYFPSVGEYTSRLEVHGFEVRRARLFDRPTTLAGPDGLREWLAQFGDSLLAAVPDDEHDAVLGGIEDRLREDCFDGADWTVGYRRLRFVATL